MTIKTAPAPIELPVDDYQVEQQIGFVLRLVHQRASSIFDTVMGEFGVTPTQFTTMIKLQDADEISQNRLGRMAAMDPATTFGVISRLKKRGSVTQRTDPDDARRVLLRLSPDGADQTSRMRTAALQVSKVTLAPLTIEEQKTLLSLLGKLT